MKIRLKKGDKVKRNCSNDCPRRIKCPLPLADRDKEGTIRRMNPRVDNAFDVEDEKGVVTTCPRSLIERISEAPSEKATPYWGPSQNDPIKVPEEAPKEAPEEAPEEVQESLPGVEDFGYGPSCAHPKCHAHPGENHSPLCPRKGKFELPPKT